MGHHRPCESGVDPQSLGQLFNQLGATEGLNKEAQGGRRQGQEIRKVEESEEARRCELQTLARP